MIIARIRGGFANQVFCMIAALEASKQLDTELRFDISNCMNEMTRGCFINFLASENYKLLNYHLVEPSGGEESIHKDFLNLYGISSIKEGVDIWKKRGGVGSLWQKNMSLLGKDKDYYLFGFFNGESFSPNFADNIRKELQKIYQNEYVAKYTDQIVENSIGIHIRRGDYAWIGIVDDEIYYKAAINYFVSTRKDIDKIYIFTDDIEWAREKFLYEKVHIVNSMGGYLGDIIELYCLAKCKYKILSKVSSYGMLARYINGDDPYNVLIPAYDSSESIVIIKTLRKVWRFITEKSGVFRKIMKISAIGFSEQQQQRWITVPNKFKLDQVELDNIYKEVENRIKLIVNIDNNDEILRLLDELFLWAKYIEPQIIEKLCYVKYRALVITGKNAEADFLFRRLWFNHYGETEFHYLSFLNLLKLQRYDEAALEFTCIKDEYYYDCVKKILEERIVEYDIEQEIELIEKLKVSNYQFIFVVDELTCPASFLNGVYMLGWLLRRLNNEVCFIMKDNIWGRDSFEINYNNSKYLLDQDLTNFGCKWVFHQDLDTKMIERINDCQCRKKVIFFSDKSKKDINLVYQLGKDANIMFYRKYLNFDNDVHILKQSGYRDVQRIDREYFLGLHELLGELQKGNL